MWRSFTRSPPKPPGGRAPRIPPQDEPPNHRAIGEGSMVRGSGLPGVWGRSPQRGRGSIEIRSRRGADGGLDLDGGLEALEVVFVEVDLGGDGEGGVGARDEDFAGHEGLDLV